MTKRDLSTLDLTQFDLPWWRDNSVWILPQTMALISQLPLVRKDDRISPSLTLDRWRETMKTHPTVTPTTWRAIFNNVLNPTRSQVLSATQVSNTRWCEGVPLVLSSFREHRGVLYSSWDWTDSTMERIVGAKIWESLISSESCHWTVDELVRIRQEGLRVRTGVKAGSMRSLTHYLPWGSCGDQTFRELPVLTKYMITQTWCYHPSVRHPLMICDWDHMDTLPPPLVSDDIIQTKKSTSKTHISFDDIFQL